MDQWQQRLSLPWCMRMCWWSNGFVTGRFDFALNFETTRVVGLLGGSLFVVACGWKWWHCGGRESAIFVISLFSVSNQIIYKWCWKLAIIMIKYLIDGLFGFFCVYAFFWVLLNGNKWHEASDGSEDAWGMLLTMHDFFACSDLCTQ